MFIEFIRLEKMKKSQSIIVPTRHYFHPLLRGPFGRHLILGFAMVIVFGDTSALHGQTSFLASNLVGYVEIDPTKTTTSSSDANYIASSDIADKRYMCDTPLTARGGCSCAVGGKGLVGDAGRTFPGSALNASGAQTAVIGPLGIQGPANGVPHPAFRFAQKVTDVNMNMTDITFPGKERVVWDAKFRLTGPDGSLGSDYLPSSLQPIGGETQTFRKMCSAINSWRTYKLKVLAGGDAPIDQTIVMKASIFQPTKIIHPAKAGKTEAPTQASKASMKVTGPRLFRVGGEPGNDSAPAVRSSFACRYETVGSPGPDTYAASNLPILIKPQMRGFPSVTATTFAARNHASTSFPDGDCCDCGGAPLKNPPGCHKPPTVTIHVPRADALTNFF
jgi:hypothetical protein